jgi:hypothetical protein
MGCPDSPAFACPTMNPLNWTVGLEDDPAVAIVAKSCREEEWVKSDRAELLYHAHVV